MSEDLERGVQWLRSLGFTSEAELDYTGPQWDGEGFWFDQDEHYGALLCWHEYCHYLAATEPGQRTSPDYGLSANVSANFWDDAPPIHGKFTLSHVPGRDTWRWDQGILVSAATADAQEFLACCASIFASLVVPCISREDAYGLWCEFTAASDTLDTVAAEIPALVALFKDSKTPLTETQLRDELAAVAAEYLKKSRLDSTVGID